LIDKEGQENSMKNSSMKKILVLIFALAAPLATANQGLMNAVITCSTCTACHMSMRMGSDERCVRSCVRAGAKYALWDGRNAYVLSDQIAAEPWAGRKVRVLATLNAKTKEVQAISIVAR
jgi:Fe-S-cluster-containing dehydrogenase component